ncbi:MAG: hypothetical protein ACSNEK_01700 [Parachlamydiaceae bacterium]
MKKLLLTVAGITTALGLVSCDSDHHDRKTPSTRETPPTTTTPPAEQGNPNDASQ